jgi:hypothetical protein
MDAPCARPGGKILSTAKVRCCRTFQSRIMCGRAHLPHCVDAISHHLQLPTPLGKQGVIRENRGRNCCAVPWGATVHGPNDSLQLTLHSSGFSGAATNDVQCSCALAIEPHVLGKRLSQEHWHSSVGKEPQGVCIFVQAAARKALQGTESLIKPLGIFDSNLFGPID